MSTNQPQDPIQQVIDQVQQPPAAAFPLQVQIPGTPQVFKGNTPQEVLDQLVRAQSEATQAIRAARQEAQDARSQVEQLKAQIPAPPVDATEAQRAAYYETWAKDPDKAAQIQMAKMLGVPPERVADVLRKAVENSVVNTAADEFLTRCPDFPQNPQSAAMMKQAIAARFGASMEAASADNLEVVYHQLVREGHLQPRHMAIQGIVQENTVMPQIRGGGAPPSPVNDIIAQAHDMKLEDLKKVIDRLSAQGAR